MYSMEARMNSRNPYYVSNQDGSVTLPGAGERFAKPPKRIIEMIARAPFRFIGEPVKNVPLDTKAINASIAEKIISDRIHAVFMDASANWSQDVSESFDMIMNTPRPMPPFKEMWMEGSLFNIGDLRENHFRSVGAFVSYHDLEEDPILSATMKENVEKSFGKEIAKTLFDRDQVTTEDLNKEVKIAAGGAFISIKDIDKDNNDDVFPKHMISFYVYGSDDINDIFYGPVSRAYIFLGRNSYNILKFGIHDGTGLRREAPLVIIEDLHVPPGYSDLENKEQTDLVSFMTSLTLSACTHALGLINCSNVKMECEGRTNDDVSSKRRAKERLPWLKYHVLKVKTGGQWRNLESRSTGVGNSPAMHVVRGHFSDYSQGKGLFGKYKRPAVWIPSHVRGKHEQGVVIKDYKMEVQDESSASKSS